MQSNVCFSVAFQLWSFFLLLVVVFGASCAVGGGIEEFASFSFSLIARRFALVLSLEGFVDLSLLFPPKDRCVVAQGYLWISAGGQ